MMQSQLAALAAAVIILQLTTSLYHIDAFQIVTKTTQPRLHMASFQEARLAEQLRFRINQAQRREAAADEARALLALEELSYEQQNEDNEGKFMPEAPMMTYQKYVTMQEKRVKVTIRYSAAVGLRPFYLTVADRIKSYHPDVLLERRILPKPGSKAGGDEAIFEVLVDGKVVVGSKKTMFLKVRTSSGSSSASSDKDDDDKRSEKMNQSGEMNFAGGRSVFVSMERLEQELVKARKKRRPSTMYKNKEDALRGATSFGRDGDDSAPSHEHQLENVQRGQAMTDAVRRLERLKELGSNKKKL